jgi:NTE family protein
VQAAYIQAAHELGFRPTFIVGTSVGALNGAWVARNPDHPQGLLDVWRTVDRRPVLPANPLRLARQVLRRSGGVFPNDLVRTLVRDHIGDVRFDELELPLAVVATNLCEGRKHVFERGKLAPAIYASTAIPGLFDPVEIGGDRFVDGCVTASVDIETAMDLGATEILAIDLTPAPDGVHCRTAVGVLKQSMGILAHATTDAMAAFASKQLPFQLVRPDLTRLSPWRLACDEAEIVRALNGARARLTAALAPDGSVRASAGLAAVRPTAIREGAATSLAPRFSTAG